MFQNQNNRFLRIYINLDAIPATLAIFYYPITSYEEARQVLKVLIQYDNDRYHGTSLRSYGFIMKYNGKCWEHESEFYTRFIAAGDS